LQKTDALTVLQLSPADTQRIAQLIQNCIDYSYPKTVEWFNRSLYNHIESLLIEIQALQPDKPAPLDKRVQNALYYIQNNYRADWGIAELAAHSHLSQGRLSVLFKESLGLSPISMRDSLRMNDACDLLINSQHSIRHIGEELGYKDPMHFSRRFSELVGQSPRQYRSAHRRASLLDVDFP
jgi:AraC family transcriptional regulator of arabinose operon